MIKDPSAGTKCPAKDPEKCPGHARAFSSYEHSRKQDSQVGLIGKYPPQPLPTGLRSTPFSAFRGNSRVAGTQRTLMCLPSLHPISGFEGGPERPELATYPTLQSPKFKKHGNCFPCLPSLNPHYNPTKSAP